MSLKKNDVAGLIVILLCGAAFIYFMNYMFEHSTWVREIFSGSSSGVNGEVAPNSGKSLADLAQTTARISMLIFSVITVLQVVAFGVGYIVVSGIRKGGECAKIKLKQLDNAEIFFDVPLYVGLFGTVSAFLVMTFSPQSSRLIAYSSTLIGIIFSLVLRLSMQYPLRRKLILISDKEGADK